MNKHQSYVKEYITTFIAGNYLCQRFVSIFGCITYFFVMTYHEKKIDKKTFSRTMNLRRKRIITTFAKENKICCFYHGQHFCLLVSNKEGMKKYVSSYLTAADVLRGS